MRSLCSSRRKALFVRSATVASLVVVALGSLGIPAAGGDVGVELGPATRYFATPDADPDLGTGLPPLWRSSGGDEKGKGKGKAHGKDKGEEKESGEGSGSNEGSESGEPSQPEDCWAWHEAERGFLEKINGSRVAHGRSPVRLDRELSRVARRHTWDMLGRQTLYHTPEDTLRRRVTKWLILGENVGRGGGVDSLHRAFMESEPHRENVLYRPFNHVGIGTVRDESGLLWVTILLEAYEDPGTTLEMPPMCT